jgi:HEAT repeat protein
MEKYRMSNKECRMKKEKPFLAFVVRNSSFNIRHFISSPQARCLAVLRVTSWGLQKIGLVLVISLTLCGLACRSRPPYEGKSIAALQRMLHDPNPRVQVQGAFGLSQLGAKAKDAVPDLAEVLRSPDSLVRQNAALALEQIGPDAQEAVPALKEALHDPEWQVRRQACLALARIGPAAKPAIPDLEKLAKDPVKRVREAARDALKRIKA